MALREIIVPDSVEIIGFGAFGACEGLQRVVIGDGVTTIEDQAFNSCTGLKSLTIGKSLKTLGADVFSYSYGLEELRFNATAMDDFDEKSMQFFGAGQQGKGLTVTIGANVTRIPAFLFSQNANDAGIPKITKLIFEEGSVCQIIGDFAFYSCPGLTELNLPNSVHSIGHSSFKHCSGLTELILPDGVRSIGEAAFMYCTNLKTVTIGVNVVSIGDSAFTYAHFLEELNFNATAMNNHDNDPFYVTGAYGNGITINIGANVERIPANIFKNMAATTTVIFAEGSKCNWIGANAFDGCTGLTVANYPGSREDWEKVNVETGNQPLLNALRFGKTEAGDLDENGNVDNRDVEYLLWYTLFPEDYPL